MAHVRPSSTVDSALRASDDGVPDVVNAAAHDVSVKTIRRWRRDYQRRGLARGQAHTSVTCPRCEDAALDEGAYAELLGWYLGDGYISRGRRDVYNLHIYNDEQYVGVNLRIFHLLGAVKPGGKPHSRRLPGCLAITVSWKHWPCLLPQHGPGRKHERPIVLEGWQDEIVRAHPDAFLRGLFHSDGARVNNWSTHPAPWLEPTAARRRGAPAVGGWDWPPGARHERRGGSRPPGPRAGRHLHDDGRPRRDRASAPCQRRRR